MRTTFLAVLAVAGCVVAKPVESSDKSTDSATKSVTTTVKSVESGGIVSQIGDGQPQAPTTYGPVSETSSTVVVPTTTAPAFVTTPAAPTTVETSTSPVSPVNTTASTVLTSPAPYSLPTNNGTIPTASAITTSKPTLTSYTTEVSPVGYTPTGGNTGAPTSEASPVTASPNAAVAVQMHTVLIGVAFAGLLAFLA